MTHVDSILGHWPSLAAVARDLGVPRPTVAAWRQRQSIPLSRFPAIIAAAKTRGVDITVEALVAANLAAPQHIDNDAKSVIQPDPGPVGKPGASL